MPKSNKHKLLISREGLLAINKALLKNPFITCNKLRAKLSLVAKLRRYIKMLGWRRVETKYCQIVSFENCVKRFIYGCCCKIFNETFDDSVNIVECSVVVRFAGYKNYRKSSSDILPSIGWYFSQGINSVGNV